MPSSKQQQHHHRAGSLRQTNKKHKSTGGRSSKRSLDRAAGAGKVASSSSSGKQKRLPFKTDKNGIAKSKKNKADRLHAAKQRREASRRKVIESKRRINNRPLSSSSSSSSLVGFGKNIPAIRTNDGIVPRIVGIISLSSSGYDSRERDVMRFLLGGRVGIGNKTRDASNASTGVGYGELSTMVRFDAHVKSITGGMLTFLTLSGSFRGFYSSCMSRRGRVNDDNDDDDNEDASVSAALDLCRVCDLVLFVLDGSNASTSNTKMKLVTVPGQQRQRQRRQASMSSSHSTTTAATFASDRLGNALVSRQGDRILAAVKAQGLPTPITVLVHRDKKEEEVEKEKSGKSAKGEEKEDNNEDDDDDNDAMNDRECFMSVSSSCQRSAKSARRSEMKRRAEMRKFLSRFAAAEFGEGARTAELDMVEYDEEENDDGDGVVDMDVGNGRDGRSLPSALASASSSFPTSDKHPDRAALIRTLCTCSASPPKWVRSVPRPYLVADGGGGGKGKNDDDGVIGEEVSFANSSSSVRPVSYDPAKMELTLTGYIRGGGTDESTIGGDGGGGGTAVPWDVNAPVHVPNLGTFTALRIVHAPIQCGNGKGSIRGGEDAAAAVAAKGTMVSMVTSDPSRRESLDMFAVPDALDGEQNLIGFDVGDHDREANEYDNDGESGEVDNTAAVLRPAGWSDYQSAWIDAVDADANDDDDGDIAVDHGELAAALNAKKTDTGPSSAYGMDIENDGDDDSPESASSLHQRKSDEIERRKKDRKMELDFPDEVELKEDEKGRERYQRYRSLKSFRKSYWDPKENLPEEYGSLYHFANFRATRGDVMSERRDLAEAGRVSKWRRWFGLAGAVADKAKEKHVNGEDGMHEDDDDDDDDDEEKEIEEMLDGCVPPGSRVSLTLGGVPPRAYERFVRPDGDPSPLSLLVAVQLLPHENKASVVHMGVSHTKGCDLVRGMGEEAGRKTKAQEYGGNDDDDDDKDVLLDPVKSKDVLTFRCGWRTWTARPIFSQHNLNSDKHKFERYLPVEGGGYVAASCYGPVTYGPCPVLVFREGRDKVDVGGGSGLGRERTKRQLVAVGTTLGADADRIVVKRIVLTGYPVRVHKRTATVKYMFYDPEDVKWFKPAGLTTKHGLQGNIVESVGDHGTMKCLFNAPIKQHDTVCLPLYKRIYPKYAPAAGSNGGDDATVSSRKHHLVVL